MEILNAMDRGYERLAPLEKKGGDNSLTRVDERMLRTRKIRLLIDRDGIIVTLVDMASTAAGSMQGGSRASFVSRLVELFK